MLNLCTTLTPATALERYHNHPSSKSLHLFSEPVPGPTRKVDITSPVISNVLSSLAIQDQQSQFSYADSAKYDEILVRVAPPLHVRVSREDPVRSGQIIHNFMESWTRLVGDEVLSKWIVLVLAVSVALNGYLLKGIAVGGTNALRPVVSQAVRFGGDDSREKTKEDARSQSPPVLPKLSVLDSPVLPEADSTPEVTPRPAFFNATVLAPVAPIPVPARSLPLNLHRIDQKLEEQRAHELERSILPSSTISTTPPPEGIRSFDEILEIFENGPRPVANSLAMLNDEEVILLSQKGKIAAYALEKMLGDNGRAVLIRRALICKSGVPFLGSRSSLNRTVSSCFPDQDPRTFRCPNGQLRLFSGHWCLLRKCHRLHAHPTRYRRTTEDRRHLIPDSNGHCRGNAGRFYFSRLQSP